MSFKGAVVIVWERVCGLARGTGDVMEGCISWSIIECDVVLGDQICVCVLDGELFHDVVSAVGIFVRK